MAVVERLKPREISDVEQRLLEEIRKEIGVVKLSNADIDYVLGSKYLIAAFAAADTKTESPTSDYKIAQQKVVNYLKAQHRFDNPQVYQTEVLGTDEEVETLNDYGPDSLNTLDKKFNDYLARNTANPAEPVKITSILGETSIFQFARTILPPSKEAFVRCDLNLETAIVSDDRTTFTWNLNWGPPKLERGYINLNANLGRVARMRIGQTMFSNMTLTAYTTLTTRRTAFDIQEFNDESFIHQNGARFHFLQILGDRYYDKYGNNIRTSPFQLNKGWYRFARHHMPPSTLTLTFTDLFGPTRISFPATPISIPAIQWYQKTVASFFYDLAPIDDPIEIAAPYYDLIPIVYEYLNKGVADVKGPGTVRNSVTFSGFTTDDPVADAALIAAYNTTRRIAKHFDFYFVNLESLPISSATYFDPPPVAVPITITFIYAPSFSTSLDLWFDIEPGDKLN